MTVPDAPTLVELEERLWQDADGALKASLVATLRAARDAVGTELARGGTPEAFRAWGAEARALDAALDVLELVQSAPVANALAGPATAVLLKGD